MEPSIYDSLTRDASSAAASLSVMMHKERAAYACGDYLRRPSRHARAVPDLGGGCGEDDSCATVEASQVSESDRLQIVDWCYSVVDKLGLDRETVASAMDLTDRFVSAPIPAAEEALADRHQFQLVAMAALYISIKTNERAALGSEFFASLSQGTYSVAEIEAAELDILSGLSWRIHAPSGLQIAHHLLSLALPGAVLHESTWGLILDEVRFQAEHAVRDYRLATGRRSTVALAAVSNALDWLGRQDRRAVLHALLHVAQAEFDFDSADALRAAKARLRDLVGGSDAVSASPDVLREVRAALEACSSERRARVGFDGPSSTPRRRSAAATAEGITISCNVSLASC